MDELTSLNRGRADATILHAPGTSLQQGVRGASKLQPKGWQGPCLIALAGAEFDIAWTTTKASALCVEARRDDYI